MDAFVARYYNDNGMYCFFMLHVLMCTAYTNLANTFLMKTDYLLKRSGSSLKIKFLHSFLTLGSEGRPCKDCFLHSLALNSIFLSSEHLYRLVSA